MEKKVNLIGISGYIGSGKDTVAKIICYIQDQYKRHGGLIDPFDPENVDYITNSSWENKKFAGKLKQIVSLLTGIPLADLEKTEVKNSFLPKEWDKVIHTFPIGDSYSLLEGIDYLETSQSATHWTIKRRMTVRDLLQTAGTDAMRNVIHPDIHVIGLFADYKPYVKEPYMPGGSNLHKMAGYRCICKSCKNSFLGFKRQTRCPDCIEKEGDIYPNWIVTDVRFPNNEAPAIKTRDGIILRINNKRCTRGTHDSEISMDYYLSDDIIENNGTLDELIFKVLDFCHKYHLIN